MAMWQQDLESSLQDVDQCKGFKYLPVDMIKNLRLQHLRCYTKSILVRNEYHFTLETLMRYQNSGNSGGMVVTGHPGIGTNLLQKDNLAHILVTFR